MNDEPRSVMDGRRFGPGVDVEIWREILAAGGDGLGHELWCAVIRAVASAVLKKQGLIPPWWMPGDEDWDGPDPDAVAGGWLDECLPVHASLGWVLGEDDYFRNIDLTWDEKISLSGRACSLPVGEIVWELKDQLEHSPDAQDAVTEESVEVYFAEWRTRFLRRVLQEAEALKADNRG